MFNEVKLTQAIGHLKLSPSIAESLFAKTKGNVEKVIRDCEVCEVTFSAQQGLMRVTISPCRCHAESLGMCASEPTRLNVSVNNGMKTLPGGSGPNFVTLPYQALWHPRQDKGCRY